MTFQHQVQAIEAVVNSTEEAKKVVNPVPERLKEVLVVSQSPAHWNRWVMEMGSGRMVEVRP